MKMICIVCPNGCHLDVVKTKNGVAVTGNKCPRGVVYGTEEITSPKRTVTATVRCTSALHPRIPVKTAAAVPKAEIDGLLKKLYALRVELPVERGQIVFVDGEVTVVSTRSVK